jgi:hypothetical protein
MLQLTKCTTTGSLNNCNCDPTSTVMTIGTRGTFPYRLRKSEEGSAMTRPIIQKILEDHAVFPKT